MKRMNLNVPVELHNSFKAATAARGQNMTDVLLKFIESLRRQELSTKGTAQVKRAALYMRVSTWISTRRPSSMTCIRWPPSAATRSSANTRTGSAARRRAGLVLIR